MKNKKLALTLPWEEIDQGAQQQINKVLKMPELLRLAIMPDVHLGYDLCIGGVALLKEVISPSFVGYDIGCGMCHVNTRKTINELSIRSFSAKEKVYTRMQNTIPAGVGKGHGQESDITFTSASGDKNLDKRLDQLIYKQLGTLGSGNHFIEVGANAQEEVGITIHSGSRRPGYDIASYYMKKCKTITPLYSDLGQAYHEDMEWAINFALANRKLMMKRVLRALDFDYDQIDIFLSESQMINETHNHAIVNKRDGTVLHRKGATPAEKDQLGVIPANQRDGVFITRGLGNEEFLCSASHGAGRKYSRREARRRGNIQELSRAMKGIIARTDKGVLDEAPWAYKNIKEVLAAQDGILVEVIDSFKPLIVLKG